MKIYPIIFFSIVLLGCSKQKESTQSYDTSAEVAASEAIAAADIAISAASEVKVELDNKWEYETSKDEMRGLKNNMPLSRHLIKFILISLMMEVLI